MKQGVNAAVNVAKQALNKKIILAVAPFVLGFFVIVLLIIIVAAPIAAAKESVDSAINSVGTFFERFAGFFSGNGWNTDEEAFFKLLKNKELSCEQSKIVTATIMYYYQTVPTSEMTLGEEPADENSDGETVDIYDEEKFPYGELLPDLKKLVKKVKPGNNPQIDEKYDDYVKETFLEAEPYSELLNGTDEESPEREELKNKIYEEMLTISESVECPNRSSSSSMVCRGDYSNAGTADISIQDLDNVYVNVADGSCPQGTLEGCNNWIATNVPFKEYIMGVITAENLTTNEESLKAQFVATKSYTIGRIRSMGRTWHEVDGKYVIYMKGTTDDQVYKDINEQSEETIKRLEEAYDATINDFIVDDTNNVAVAQYCSDFGDCDFCVNGNGTCLAQGTANRTTGQTYKEILGYHYSAFKLYDMSDRSIQVAAVDCVQVAGTGSIRLPIDNAFSSVTSEFGFRIDPINGSSSGHEGMDFGFPTGTPIYAIAPGYVAWAGYDESGYGNYVVLGHDVDSDGLYDYATLYGHCSEVLVNTGDTVAGGQQIAKVGNTGRSTGPHLHFNFIDLGGVPTVTRESGYSSSGAVDPRPYLEDIVAGTSEFNQMIKTERKYYNQADYSNVAYCSDAKYNGDNIQNAGCLPTAFAMVVASLKDSSITPATVANTICGNEDIKQFRIPNGGTDSGILTYEPFLSKYGLNSTHYTSDYEKHIKESLNAGKVLIVNINGGTFNQLGGGHYIALMEIGEDGKVLVHDPGARELTDYHDISSITSNISNGIWVFE